jgi:thioredoxin 1
VRRTLLVTDANFEEEVLKSNMPVLVDFWASWCIPSQMMMPVLEKLSIEMEGKAIIKKINVDQNPISRDKYKIMGCPTFILFKKGNEMVRTVGAQSENQLRKIIDSIS